MAKNRVVVVTGASSGLGKGTALRFARDGWSVGLIARGQAGLDATHKEITAAGGYAMVAVADVRDAAALEAAAVTIERTLGAIEVWVNVAGTGTYAFFHEQSAADFDHVVETNLLGSANGMRIALARMVPRGFGTVVQVGSAIAHRGIPIQAAYAAAKWGLRGLQESVRAELAHSKSKVVVTLVNPPGMNTPFFSHARSSFGKRVPHVPPPVYSVADTVDAIVRAATSTRREWNVGSSSIGLMLADRFLPRTVMDSVVGRLGVDLQLTDDPAIVALRDEAFDAPGKRISAVDGPFTTEALATSPIWQVTKRPWLSLLVAAGAVGGAALLHERSRSTTSIDSARAR